MREVWRRIVKENMNVDMCNYPFYARIRKTTNTSRSYACDQWLSIENDGTSLVPHMDHTKIRKTNSFVDVSRYMKTNC